MRRAVDCAIDCVWNRWSGIRSYRVHVMCWIYHILHRNS